MTFFIALNPKRQQAQWYEDTAGSVKTKAFKRPKKRKKPQEWNREAFAQGYEQEKELIRELRKQIAKKRKDKSNECLHVIIMLMED